ncbi:hypothetical protein NE897_15075 [Yersinia ruckeri]|uniref:baseplate complex protein n=1 Tax=Yersinia ruckeri TaxID=29486 RepID=UPI0008FE2E99|nr:hypothetical protein [Yersinia ruckeri]MCW6546991.1 hypothetical protein [Yersinia ruckeri]OJB82943.1 hypothetical protein A9Q62_10560 [Yersinia ruckeri]OJB86110.1 hypothetical protein A9Q60_16495 [Yersinia ruckeri]
MTQIVMLALDGEAIPLKGLTVTPTMQFQEKDQSGQTSSTATAEQGIKAKELRISGLVPFSTPEVLTRIFALAEAKGAGGGLKRYRVANQVAQAINFRQATFTGAIDAPKQDGKMAWLVTFTLKEFMSVPEKKEARAGSKTEAKKQGAGGSGSDAAEDADKLSWFERKVLKPVNDALG